MTASKKHQEETPSRFLFQVSHWAIGLFGRRCRTWLWISWIQPTTAYQLARWQGLRSGSWDLHVLQWWPFIRIYQIISGYKWEYTFYKWVFLALISGMLGHNCCNKHLRVVKARWVMQQLTSNNSSSRWFFFRGRVLNRRTQRFPRKIGSKKYVPK